MAAERGQESARVNISHEQWIEFRALAIRRRKSVADYLGELVRRELGRSRMHGNAKPGRVSPKPPGPTDQPAPRKPVADPPPAPRIRLSDIELLNIHAREPTDRRHAL